MGSGWLRRCVLLVFVLVFVLLTTACQPPTTGPVVVDLEDGRGQISVAVESGGRDGRRAVRDEMERDPAIDVDTEICLDSGTCIRLEPGARIVESDDQWATSRVVWDVEEDASWLAFEHGGELAPVVDVYDIVAFPDQTVLVAAGELGVLTRGPDGTWSPSVADLRTIPKEKLAALGGVALAVTVTLGLVLARPPGPLASETIRLAAVLLVWPVIGVIVMLFSRSNGVGIGLVFVTASGLGSVGLVVLLAGGVRVALGAEHQYLVTVARGAAAACGAVALVGLITYVLWSRNLLSWYAFVLLCVAATVGAGVAFNRLLRRQSQAVRPWATANASRFRRPYAPTIISIVLIIGAAVAAGVVFESAGAIIVVWGGGLALLAYLLLVPKTPRVAST